MSPLFSSQQSVWVIRDYSHGETLGNGVKWQYFPARGAGELRYLYTSSGSAWSSLEGASLPPSLRQASHFRGAHLLWPAGLPQVGGEAGREEPQIEVDAGSCKVGTLKVREIHMRHCCSTSDKVIMTGVPAQILLNASWPPWASLVAQW